MNETNLVLVYITVSGRDEALSIAHALVENRLAACANVLPQATSIYRWEGKIEQAEEVVLIAKTTAVQVAELKKKVLSMHSYACPCIVALPIAEGHAPFLEWIAEETRA